MQDLKLLSQLNEPSFIDQVGEKLLESTVLYNPLTSSLQWVFDNAQILDRDKFLAHVTLDSWKHGYGFAARHSGDLWEILCPSTTHKMRVTAEFMTDFVAHLPEGTKINIGGFKNV